MSCTASTVLRATVSGFRGGKRLGNLNAGRDTVGFPREAGAAGKVPVADSLGHPFGVSVRRPAIGRPETCWAPPPPPPTPPDVSEDPDSLPLPTESPFENQGLAAQPPGPQPPGSPCSLEPCSLLGAWGAACRLAPSRPSSAPTVLASLSVPVTEVLSCLRVFHQLSHQGGVSAGPLRAASDLSPLLMCFPEFTPQWPACRLVSLWMACLPHRVCIRRGQQSAGSCCLLYPPCAVSAT